MVYLLLIIGLALVYFSLKAGKPSDKGKNFNKILQKNINNIELENVINEVKDLSDRIENIEASLMLINEKLHFINVADNIANINEQEIKLDNKQPEFIQTSSKLIETNTLNDTLYQLYDEGKTVDEISSITKTGKGEILLRLGLRKPKQ